MIAVDRKAGQPGTMPVIATPMGGPVEQVRHGVAGLIAARADPPALAAEIQRLIFEENL